MMSKLTAGDGGFVNTATYASATNASMAPGAGFV